MLEKDQFKRILIIHRKLSRSPGITVGKEELIRAVAEETDKPYSERTFYEDIKKMREDPDLEAPIKNVYGGKYKYDNPDYRIHQRRLSQDDQQHLKQALNILKQYEALGLPEGLEKTIHDLDIELASLEEPVVLRDTNPHYTGNRHLKPLLEAITGKSAIRFRYLKFGEEATNADLIASPVLLKEYAHMWYLLAWVPSLNGYRTYALDRIASLRKEPSAKYVVPDDFNATEYYRYAFGITSYYPKPPEALKLKVSKPLLDYIRENPWHASQQETKTTKTYSIFEMKVHIGYEVIREIMCWLDSVEVVEPVSLRDEIRRKVGEVNRIWDKKE